MVKLRHGRIDRFDENCELPTYGYGRICWWHAPICLTQRVIRQKRRSFHIEVNFCKDWRYRTNQARWNYEELIEKIYARKHEIAQILSSPLWSRIRIDCRQNESHENVRLPEDSNRITWSASRWTVDKISEFSRLLSRWQVCLKSNKLHQEMQVSENERWKS